MMLTRTLLMAALIAVVPMTDAVAQSRDRDRDRYEQRDDRRGPSASHRDERRSPSRDDRRSHQRDDRRANPADVARQVQSGRPGRMLGMSERGGDYTVRWEYPGGRVSDIQVDGRSGRPRD